MLAVVFVVLIPFFFSLLLVEVEHLTEAGHDKMPVVLDRVVRVLLEPGFHNVRLANPSLRPKLSLGRAGRVVPDEDSIGDADLRECAPFIGT